MYPMSLRVSMSVVSIASLLAVVTLPGCASVGDNVIAVNVGSSATITSYGSIFHLKCTAADMKDVNGNKEAVCNAIIRSIDTKLVHTSKENTQISVGEHSLSLICEYQIIGPNDHGLIRPNIDILRIEGHFDASTNYYIRASIVNDKCKVWISSSPDGAPAAGFQSTP